MRAALLAALIAAVFASACGPPPIGHYEALQNDFSIPAGWELVTERVQAPGTSLSLRHHSPGLSKGDQVLHRVRDAD